VLTNFEIRLYEGQTLTKTIANNSSLLTLDLLSGATDIYTLTAVIDDGVFDRAEVIFGGVAGVLDGLRVYEVNRKTADTILTAAEQDLYVYAGQSVILSSSPGATGYVVAWFDAIEGTSVANPYLTTAADGGTTLSVFAAATRSGW